MTNEYADQLAVMQAMASLYRKKAAVMKALEGGMVKTGENTHFKYKYVTASRIKHAVSRLLVDNGLSLQMSGLNTENSDSGKILRIQFQITLCDLDTGATESSFWFGEAQATDDKAASKCATSALKYYLISNLMIADKDEDRRDTDRGPRSTEQQPNRTAPEANRPRSSAPHWSTEHGAMDRLYKRAFKDLKMSIDEVKAALAATGKPITALSQSDAWAIVTAASKKKAS